MSPLRLTVGPPGHHNGRVFRLVARVVAGIVVVPFLALTSTLAPVHAHESDSPHAHAVVHSHFEPHDAATHDTQDPEVEPGGHVVWLDTTAVHALPFQLDTPQAVLTRTFESVAHPTSWSVVALDDSAPPHGPPRSTERLRAPPALPV